MDDFKNKFCFLFLLLFTSSCIVLNEDPKNERIIGQWQWIQSVGGFFGQTLTPESEGFNQFLYFTSDNNFTRLREDTILHSGKYELKKVDGEVQVFYKVPEDPPVISQTVDFNTPDTLILRDNCTDCYVNTYVRMD